MITAVDSNVVLDVLAGDPSFGEPSSELLKRSRAQGRLIACEVVCAEVAAGFEESGLAASVLGSMRIEFVASDEVSAIDAGLAWGAYRRGGGARARLAADFLVGAHARRHADRLLSRDRGFFERYFPTLEVIDPSVI